MSRTIGNSTTYAVPRCGTVCLTKVVREELIIIQLLKSFSPFMETEYSLPFSQESVTSPHTESHEACSQLSALFP